MPVNEHADVIVHLTGEQDANLTDERRARLNEAIKNAFIAETQDLGPEFVVNTAGPVVRHGKPSDTSHLLAMGSGPKQPASKRSGAKKSSAKKASSKKAASKKAPSKKAPSKAPRSKPR